MARGRLSNRQRRGVGGVLAVAALATVLIAPLASSSGSAGAVTIDGARSISDNVEVQFAKADGATTDVHLLAWNDFHGNLEAGGLTSTTNSPAARPTWPRP
jgi:hypothetical protein